MKRLLRWIGVVLASLMIVLLFLYLNRSDPYGRLPGKEIQGTEIAGLVKDWSFVQQYPWVTAEVRPANPYSVFVGYFLHDGVIYISSEGKRWAYFLRQDPNMRLRVGKQIYRVRATPVIDSEHLSRVRAAYRDKYPTRTLEETARRWFFQINSR
ncbi:MAG: hypothetical protein VYA53_07605 [Acidobacteriota bacterium]|nr:hypothetical protein [Acidobacteriota bacterium]